MNCEIRVRVASAADAATLVEFNQAMARETESRELPGEIIVPGVEFLLTHREHGFYLLAEIARGGAPPVTAGTLSITYEWSDWRNGMFWWIQSVYVRHEFRRMGVYRDLHEFIKREAARAGNVCGFRLYVEKQNSRAQQTYKALGMEETRYFMYEELLPER